MTNVTELPVPIEATESEKTLGRIKELTRQMDKIRANREWTVEQALEFCKLRNDRQLLINDIRPWLCVDNS